MAKRNNYVRTPFKKREAEFRINEHIQTPTVRIVGDNIEPRVCRLEEALKIADQARLDLVEISPNAEPPVCKIIDYGKFLYDRKKKQKEIAAKAQKIIVKEIRFGPNTDDHDFEFKCRNARKFIVEGAKVKAFVFFKGRTIQYAEKGTELLLRLVERLEDVAKLESEPKVEGKKMIIILTPLKQKKG